jgi:hypothetical protein
MKYDIAQLLIPPDDKHSGVGFYSTETKLVEELLEEIRKVTTGNAEFVSLTTNVDSITTGKFISLMQKDASVGWLILKIMIEKGWDCFSTSIDNEHSSFDLKYYHSGK